MHPKFRSQLKEVKIIKIIWIIAGISIFLTSCAPTPNELSLTLTPERTALAGSSPTPLSSPGVPTPLPTLTDQDAGRLVQELLEDNAGCRLPCWWGIIPGKTTWTEARHFLESFSLLIGERGWVMIPLPSPYGEPPNPATYMEHQYFIRDGIVDYIRVYNFDLAPNYYMPAFLQSYGRPTEILVRTYREYEMGRHPFLIDLFYEDKGILVEYSAENPTTEGNKLKNCLKELKSPFIYLWSPNEQKLSFQDAYEKFLDTRSLPEPIPLLLATGVDVNTFYKTYKDPEADFCIKTDKSLWP